ncbi:MAG: PIG-L family deacetylase [Candidatus Methanofastidiosum sp.]|nr:PIG-L family deacetylase [Methanofastidiosum sp.]
MIIAPHPDDEILGVGGTISKLVKHEWEVTVVIVTKGYPPMFEHELVEKGRTQAREAHQYLGVKDTVFLEAFPAAMLDQVAHSDLNCAICGVMDKIKPQLLFVPFVGDIHNDHQLVFLSALVASRPVGSSVPRKVLAYETLSETFWNAPYLAPAFAPNVFVNISEELEQKLQAMSIYSSQLKEFPEQRSIQAMKALAELRGSTINVKAAESFVLIRDIVY